MTKLKKGDDCIVIYGPESYMPTEALTYVYEGRSTSYIANDILHIVRCISQASGLEWIETFDNVIPLPEAKQSGKEQHMEHYAPEASFTDTAHNEADMLEQARDEARKAIINDLLTGEPVCFSRDEKWSPEEILDCYLHVSRRQLDKYINYVNEI